MQPNEILLRLSWLNVNFKGLTYDAKDPMDLSEDALLALYKVARQKAEEPIDQIIQEATTEFGENVRSLLLFKDLYGSYETIPVAKLCFDKSHESLGPFRGVTIKQGDSLTDFYSQHKDNPEIKAAVDFINPHRSFFNTYIPIVVQQFGDKFEVMNGNHRAFCAIKNHDLTIPALVVSKEKQKNLANSLDFKIT